MSSVILKTRIYRDCTSKLFLSNWMFTCKDKTFHWGKEKLNSYRSSRFCAHKTGKLRKWIYRWLEQCARKNTTSASCNGKKHHMCKWSICASGWGRNTTTVMGELIVSRHVAESITTDAGRFGHVGLCQLLDKGLRGWNRYWQRSNEPLQHHHYCKFLPVKTTTGLGSVGLPDAGFIATCVRANNAS